MGLNEENNEENNEESSIRDDLEAAISEESADDNESTETGEPASTETDGVAPPPVVGDGESDLSGSAIPKDATNAKETDGKKLNADNRSDSGMKAPASWSPKSREAWSKIPAEVKQEITRREKDADQLLRDSAQHRNVAEQIGRISQSYAPIMAAEGVNDPAQALEGMLKTVAQLRVGSTQQKAAKMAQLIGHYGIDIESLDNALSGAAPAPTAPNADIEQMINQRMQPVNQLMEQMGQQQQQVATNEVNNFKGEFLSDVRNDMADLIDMAATRGVQMSLQESYDKAILLNPSIQEVVQQRKQQESILGGQQQNQRRHAAAVSISGTQGAPSDQTGDGSIRGALLAAMDETG